MVDIQSGGSKGSSWGCSNPFVFHLHGDFREKLGKFIKSTPPHPHNNFETPIDKSWICPRYMSINMTDKKNMVLVIYRFSTNSIRSSRIIKHCVCMNFQNMLKSRPHNKTYSMLTRYIMKQHLFRQGVLCH